MQTQRKELFESNLITDDTYDAFVEKDQEFREFEEQYKNLQQLLEENQIAAEAMMADMEVKQLEAESDVLNESLQDAQAFLTELTGLIEMPIETWRERIGSTQIESETKSEL